MKFPERYRLKLLSSSSPSYNSNLGDPYGAFAIPEKEAKGRGLNIIASSAYGEFNWDHVSVTVNESIEPPTWEEMCLVKELFWDDNECVVQFHPAKKDHKNIHPGCLHLWKFSKEFPMPPKVCV